jgi:hypothetical protein
VYLAIWSRVQNRPLDSYQVDIGWDEVSPKNDSEVASTIKTLVEGLSQGIESGLLSADAAAELLREFVPGEHYRNNIRTILEDTVARGEDARVVARKLERYLQPGVHTALKAETRRRLGVSKDVSMEAMRLAVTEMNNAFREGTVMAAQATPGYLGVYWRLSPTSHVLADVCDDYARHNGNGFWPKGEEPTTPHPWCRCYLVPGVEDSASFKERLKEWLRDPGSQPDLERWYNGTARPFLERPAPGLEGLSGGGGLGSSGGGGSGGAGAVHPVDRLLLEMAESGRMPTSGETKEIRNYIAGLGFNIGSNTPAGGRLHGLEWEGRILKRTDMLSALEVHYLRHVVKQREWPPGTTLLAFPESVRAVILDSDSGLALSRWGGHEWHLTVVRESRNLRGPFGGDWIVVEYRVGDGFWTTAFQPERGLPSFLGDRRRSNLRWLLIPKGYSE